MQVINEPGVSSRQAYSPPFVPHALLHGRLAPASRPSSSDFLERFAALTPLIVGRDFSVPAPRECLLPHQGNDFDRPIAIFIFEAA
jgi:hypothetical protein